MTVPGPEILALARRVRLVVLDADGVLTDGAIHVLSDGREARSFFSRDGLGIRLGQRAGLRFAILSGRRSRVVEARAEELDFVDVRQGVEDKGTGLEEIAARQDLSVASVCYMGDDLVDLPALARAGFSAAPADADPGVRNSVHWVTAAGGGRGAVREVVDLLLRAQGRFDDATGPYRTGK